MIQIAFEWNEFYWVGECSGSTHVSAMFASVCLPVFESTLGNSGELQLSY